MVINFNKGGGGGGGTTYSAGTNIDITDNVISCTIDTGDTVNSAVTSANTYTDTQSAATYAAATAYTDNAISGIDLSAYYTSAQTDSAIKTATGATYNASTAFTQNYVSGQMDEVVMIDSGETTSKVELIWAGTAAEYALLHSTGATTLYIIF